VQELPVTDAGPGDPEAIVRQDGSMGAGRKEPRAAPSHYPAASAEAEPTATLVQDLIAILGGKRGGYFVVDQRWQACREANLNTGPHSIAEPSRRQPRECHLTQFS